MLPAFTSSRRYLPKISQILTKLFINQINYDQYKSDNMSFRQEKLDHTVAVGFLRIVYVCSPKRRQRDVFAVNSACNEVVCYELRAYFAEIVIDLLGACRAVGSSVISSTRPYFDATLAMASRFTVCEPSTRFAVPSSKKK